ncbi:MAG: head GIN domain-containing protein [Sphingobacteriaceae bacterium]
MKKIILSLSLVWATLSFSSAAHLKQTKLQQANQEERTVADFTGISSGGNFNVVITLGDKETLRMEGDADLLKEIESKVEKGILKIQYKNKTRLWDWNTSDKKRVNVFITAKTLTNLSLSGSGSMKVNGKVQAPDFRTVVSGSGSLQVNAESVNYSGTISGSGSIHLSGSAQNAELTVSGSGSLKAADFKAKSANITVSGSGGASLYVEQTLKGTLSGSGNIRYAGNPSVTETKSGSGSISKLK